REHTQALVGLAGDLRDHAVVRENVRLGEAREPVRTLAHKPQCLLEGVRGIVVAPETQVDGRNDIPAATILGSIPQTRLDLGNELVDARAASWCGPARGKRLA